MRGSGGGRITALGGQTKVSKESIKVAWEAASQLQAEFDLPRNFAKRYDVTVLDTRLAVKKDGPSAGLAYLTGIVAAFRGTAPRPDLAMTGEITILGKVLAVGGIEEKVRAAAEAGYATVLIPAENRDDVASLPGPLRQAIEIIQVATVQEALPVIFAAPRRSKPEPPPKPEPAVPIATIIPTATLIEPSAPPLAPAKLSEKAAEPPAEPSLDDRIRDLLQKDPGAYIFADIAAKLAVPLSTATRAGKQLAEAGILQSAKRGRSTVYYLAALNPRPDYDLFAPVEAVKLVVLEPEARQLASTHLASSYLVFAQGEEIVTGRLAYLPLYKVRFSATVSEGWIFKHDVENRARQPLFQRRNRRAAQLHQHRFRLHRRRPEQPNRCRRSRQSRNLRAPRPRRPADGRSRDAGPGRAKGDRVELPFSRNSSSPCSAFRSTSSQSGAS